MERFQNYYSFMVYNSVVSDSGILGGLYFFTVNGLTRRLATQTDRASPFVSIFFARAGHGQPYKNYPLI